MVTCCHLELNLALIILSDTGSHSSRHCAASLDRMKPTPLSWFSPSSIPEYSTVSPVAILNLPQEFHLISLTPKILIPYLCISFTTWAHLPVSNNVLTFHCPIFTHAFGDSNLIGSLCVILCFARCSNRVLALCTPASRQGAVVTLISVSVISFFFRERVISPLPNPQPGGPGAVLRLVSTLRPIRHG